MTRPLAQTTNTAKQAHALEDFGKGLLRYVYQERQIIPAGKDEKPELAMGDFRLTVNYYSVFTLRYVLSGCDLTLISGPQHIVYHYLLEFIRQNNIPCDIPATHSPPDIDELTQGWTAVRI
jgi:hypothetical protein